MIDLATTRIDMAFLKAVTIEPRPIGGGLGQVPEPVATRLARKGMVRISGNTVSSWGAL